MNKLDVVKFLLDEVEEEQQNFKAYEKVEKEADKKNKEIKDFSYWRYMRDNWNKRYPSKSKIKNNLKMIRRLTLDIEKECES